MREQTFSDGQKFQIIQGDITQQDVDAIVNPANSQLQHGGGVAGIIVRCGGHGIQVESDQWVRDHGPVAHAKPAYTSGGDLPCRYVIHAVGPVWGVGDEDAKLAAAVSGSLCRANELNLDSIALPAISTGIFGFPKTRAAEIIFKTVAEYFNDYHNSSLSLVRLVLFDQSTVDSFIQVWDSLAQE
ncbi:MAG: macro domain-containing protein [Chloroflexi bacterium]|nr:macro domain-containing protein [Chloroflexota bacterium]